MSSSHEHQNKLTRRQMLTRIAASAVGGAVASLTTSAAFAQEKKVESADPEARLSHAELTKLEAQSAKDVEAARAEVAALEAKIAEAKKECKQPQKDRADAKKQAPGTCRELNRFQEQHVKARERLTTKRRQEQRRKRLQESARKYKR